LKRPKLLISGEVNLPVLDIDYSYYKSMDQPASTLAIEWVQIL